MFKKLRKRLILTLSMIGVAICTVLFTALYIVNYSNAMRAIDMILTVALSGEGQRLPDSAAAIPNDKIQGYCYLIEITSDGNYNLKGMENFSELHDFMDVPLKNFSSGMLARLAFAIATIGTPDILIVDEVLAVGDFKFQQKCEQRIQHMMTKDTSILFVSHSIDQVESLCTRAVWIEKGHIRMDGPVHEVCQLYRQI